MSRSQLLFFQEITAIIFFFHCSSNSIIDRYQYKFALMSNWIICHDVRTKVKAMLLLIETHLLPPSGPRL